MSIQKILNIAESLTIDRRRLVSVQYTRSEIAKLSETVSRNPWKFTLGLSAVIPYADSRDILEAIDKLDRNNFEVISFDAAKGAAKGLNFMFAYRGDTLSVVQGMTVVSFSGNQLVLNVNKTVAASGGAGAILFRAGDFIQIAGYPYPFTTRDDVVRGNNATVTITTHRPNFISASLVGLGIVVGNEVQFKVFCPNMPVYKLTPGGQNALVTWSSDFLLYEYTGDIQ